MTTPDLTTIVPLKAKAWVALITSVLTVVGPWILSASLHLPQPWPVLVGAVFGLLTVFGVYRAPYVPAGAVLAPAPAPSSDKPAAPWPKP